ncbi:hypothetical protein H4R19_003445 [Coemansia spiralis]|nr:hypothetical protein H4R19_003445 [Coemansia spiralis]
MAVFFSLLTRCALPLLLCALAVAGRRADQASGCPGYKVAHLADTAHGFRAALTLAGPPCNVFGTDVRDLVLHVTHETDNRLHVHIEDAARAQFQIPDWVVPLDTGRGVEAGSSSLRLKLTHSDVGGLGFQVLRGNEAIFDTTGRPLVFEDQYIEVTSRLPANANIYGLGESPDWFRRDPTNTTQTLWARDAADPFRENTYGAHAVYMELRSGQFHGAYLHNSHGMDIVLADGAIQYRVLGGTADFYFFAGPSALQVIEQYTELVGRPAPIPYWALGLHNCRWGYRTVDEANQVIANYSRARIPLEAAWTDIDYMDAQRDFTFDASAFPLDGMRRQLEGLHAQGQKMVLIVDPAIQANRSYAPYVRGQEMDVFVKQPDGSEYIGQVWPGYTAFPDWFAPNVSRWWAGELNRFLDALPVDGLWIDMNEAASFCTGSCGSGRPADEIPALPWLTDRPHRPLNRSNPLLVPPYAIHNPQKELSDKTIETTAIHANGVAEYHVHNLYGHMEARLTHAVLQARRPSMRPFVLSRSTFAGTGAVASHWTGDNSATWQDLQLSVAAVFDFGLFGIPMAGADICGFMGNTTAELCARWIELGAFYPFARVHNTKDAAPQELYRWPLVADAARRALAVRYALLPYIYTAYQDAVERGWPVARPLVFEFPAAPAIANDRQLLLGDAILVSPVLAEGARSVRAFFPRGRWYDWYDHSLLAGADADVTLPAPLEHVNVHIRAGRIVPVQHPAMTTAESRRGDYELIVAVDEHGTATGRLYLDDGATLASPHRWLGFAYRDRTLWIEQRSGCYAVPRPLAKLTLLGIPGVRAVAVNGTAVACTVEAAGAGATVVSALHIDLNSPTRVSLL